MVGAILVCFCGLNWAGRALKSGHRGIWVIWVGRQRLRGVLFRDSGGVATGPPHPSTSAADFRHRRSNIVSVGTAGLRLTRGPTHLFILERFFFNKVFL